MCPYFSFSPILQMALKGIGGKGICCGKMDEVEWLENITNEVVQQMVAHCETGYEQHHLLALLAKAMFGRNFTCHG